VSSLSTGLSSTASSVSSLSSGVSNSVQYDDASRTKITLGGVGATSPVILTNVAAGVNPTDAVNLGQLTSLSTTVFERIASLSTSTSTGLSTITSNIGSLSTGASTTAGSIGSLSTSLSTTAGDVGSLSTGASTTASNIGSLSTGLSTTTSFIGSLSTGLGTAGGQGAVAIGQQSVASGTHSVAAGSGAKATADGAVAMGAGAQATGANAIAMGTGALATDSSQAIGANALAGSGGVALGQGADAGGTPQSQAQNVSKGTAIGFGALVTQSGGVALGSGSVASTAAGAIGYIPVSANAQQEASIRATTSTQAAVSVGDAANGQFRQITGVAAGSADSDATNVAQLRAVSSAARASGVQYATNPDGSVNYNQVTLGNDQAADGTRISNVAPGIAPTDAVNLGQLGAVQNQLQGQIASTQRIAYSGVAMATAMSTLPQATTPGKNLMSVGVGNYAGYSAVAIGYSARSKDGKWIYKINGGYSSTRFTLGVGVGYEFD